MLSFKIPALNETITLNGTKVVIHQLPLFFQENLTRVYRVPEKEGPARTSRLLRQISVEMVVALHQSDNVQDGLPAWDAGEATWDAYADACLKGLVSAGITSKHYRAIQDAILRLERRQIENVDAVGND